MISKVLIVTDSTEQSSVSVLDAFQMIRRSQQSVKALFISYLSDPFKKGLGPNTLNHWMKEEEECMARASSYFARMDIPYDSKVIIVPPWEMVFYEMSDEVKDLIILHSELLEKWKKDKANCALCAEVLAKSGCPILVVNSSKGEDTMDLVLQA